MVKVLQVIGGVIAAIALAMVLLVAVEFFSSIVHPLPSDFDGTMEAMCAHVALYPAWVLAVVVPMWAAIAYISTWTAYHIGGRVAACVIAASLLAGVLFNVAMLPYPIWFKAISVAAIAGAVLVAMRNRQPDRLRDTAH